MAADEERKKRRCLKHLFIQQKDGEDIVVGMYPAVTVATVHQHDVDLVAEGKLGYGLGGAGRVEPSILSVIRPQRSDWSVVYEHTSIDLCPRM